MRGSANVADCFMKRVLLSRNARYWIKQVVWFQIVVQSEFYLKYLDTIVHCVTAFSNYDILEYLKPTRY